jgi:ribosomal protein S18 acetylase RimI-like enzyme
MVTIETVANAGQAQAARTLMRGYFSWFFAQVPGSDQVEAFRGWEQELVQLPQPYVAPQGCFLLALAEGQACGCVALKEVDGRTAEIKRLYVAPRYRGRQVGQQLVQAVLQKARSLGYRRMLLDSHCSMQHAHGVYRAAGFQDVAAPSDFPEEQKPIVVFMAMDL